MHCRKDILHWRDCTSETNWRSAGCKGGRTRESWHCFLTWLKPNYFAIPKLRDHPRSLDTHHSAPQTCDRIRNFLRKVTNSFCLSHPHQENALIYIFCHKTFRQGVSFWSETRKSRWQKSVSWQIGTPPVSVVIIYYYTNKKSDPSSHKPDFWLCLFGGGVGRE